MEFGINDIIIYNGKKYFTVHTPYDQYVRKVLNLLYLESLHELFLKTYWATWEILDNKLFLTEVSGHINVTIPQNQKHKKVFKGLEKSETTLGLDYHMHGKDVDFAEWYTGNIILFDKEIQSVNDIENYEEEIAIMQIKNGRIINATITNMQNLQQNYYHRFIN